METNAKIGVFGQSAQAYRINGLAGSNPAVSKKIKNDNHPIKYAKTNPV